MTKLENHLTNLPTVRLPKEVKTRMRSELIAYANLHTAEAKSVPSPFFSGLTMRMYSGLAIALLLIISVGGTAYASENTLPGDILYSVKVKIAEPVQTALIPNEKGKAAWSAILAERRLEEAAQLAAANKLTPKTQTELAANFTANVAASEMHAASIERMGDTDTSLSIQSDLEARLTAHEQILTVLATHYAAASTTEETTANTTNSLASLLTTVREHQQTITASRIALEKDIAPDTTSAGAKAETKREMSATAPDDSSHSTGMPNIAARTARIADHTAIRTKEISSILDQHAALLAKFLPAASSTEQTASHSATSTDSQDEVIKTTVDNTDSVK